MKILLTLLLVALLAFSLWRSPSLENIALPTDTPDEGIDAYMKNFSMKSMGTDGDIALTLSAESLEHDRASDYSRLKRPDIQLLDKQHQWRITASQGRIDQNRQQLSLEQQVVIEQIDQPDPVRITTDQLSIDLDAQIASTDQLVQLQTGDFALESNGLILDNQIGRLTLLTDVRGRYVSSD